MAIATPPLDDAVGTIPRGNDDLVLHVDFVDVGTNVRSTPPDDSLDELVASIRAHGVLQPIRVTGPHAGGRYRLIYGQRRLLASRIAGCTTIPALVDPSPRDKAATAIEQLVENLQRADLDSLEAAQALRSVLDADGSLTQAALADTLGRSAAWVSNTLRLLELPKPVKKLLDEGKLTASHAKVIAGLEADVQAAVGKEAARRGLSAHDLEKDAGWIAKGARREKEHAAEQRQRTAAVKAAALDAVEKREIALDAPIIVSGWDGTRAVVHALQKRGHADVRESTWAKARPGEGFCDCVAWQIDTGGGYGDEPKVKVSRACIDDAHPAAAREADREAWDAKQAATQATIDRVGQALEAEVAGRPLPPLLARVLLRTRIGWRGEEWAQGREGAGSKKQPDVWGAITALDDDELGAELVAIVRDMELRHGELDLERIVAELEAAG